MEFVYAFLFLCCLNERDGRSRMEFKIGYPSSFPSKVNIRDQFHSQFKVKSLLTDSSLATSFSVPFKFLSSSFTYTPVPFEYLSSSFPVSFQFLFMFLFSYSHFLSSSLPEFLLSSFIDS